MEAIWILKRPQGTSVIARPFIEIDNLEQVKKLVPLTMVVHPENLNTNNPVGVYKGVEYFAFRAPKSFDSARESTIADVL